MIGIRRLSFDGGVVAAVVAAGLLMGAPALLNVPQPMERLPKVLNPEWMVLLKQFGSEERWRQQVLWWWLSLPPTAAAVFVRRRHPMTAFALAVLGSVAHVLSPALPHLPADLVVALALYGVAATAADRRVSLAVLSAAQTGLYGLALAAVNGLPEGKFGKYTVVGSPAPFSVSGAGQRAATGRIPGAGARTAAGRRLDCGRPHPHPAGPSVHAPGTRRGLGPGAGAANRAGGGRRTRPHRPGTPRRRRARPVRDGGPGPGRPGRAESAPRTGRGGTGHHRHHRPGVPGRDAPTAQPHSAGLCRR